MGMIIDINIKVNDVFSSRTILFYIQFYEVTTAWNTGLLDYWTTVLLDYWTTGLLDY